MPLIMDLFRIEIRPAVPRPVTIIADFKDLNPRRREITAKFTEEYLIIYQVGDAKFGYYPTDILTALNDLVGERDELKAHRSHYVSLGGYNVAYAKCNEGRVWFLDPPPLFGREEALEAKGDGLDISLVIEALQEAASGIWEYIGSRMA